MFDAARGWTRTAGALAWSTVSRPPPRAAVPVQRRGAAPLVEAGQPLSVLCWNIQFSGSRDKVFFYDGGPAVHVSRDTVRRTLDRVVEVVREADADVVLLQEVDRSSDRTARVDQHAELVARTDYACAVSTPYYRSPWVPYPPQQPLGRMDMHLSALSRVRIESATRWQLPLLRESRLRRQFNLRRALLQLELPRVGGGALRVFDTHLSAFSRGDGTLPRQVGALVEHLNRAEGAGLPWVLAGDFNALPPDDDPTRLGADAALYAEERTPIGVLFDTFSSAVPPSAHREHPERFRTLLPPGRDVADRALDHVFTSRSVRVLDAVVLRKVTDVSDHLPLRVTLEVP